MAGSIHGLLGENGCGKSTMIKTLSGVQQPDSGQILHKGKAVQINDPLAARSLGIATVFQEFSIVPTLSVGENIFLGNMPRNRFGVMDWVKIHSESARVLAEMEVKISPDAITGTLSVGEQQLVEIAKAIAMDAQMIILDEPTTNLSVMATNQLLETMKELKRLGVAQVIISHRLTDIFEVGDRVMVLKRGQNVGDRWVSETTEQEVLEIIVSGTPTA